MAASFNERLALLAAVHVVNKYVCNGCWEWWQW